MRPVRRRRDAEHEPYLTGADDKARESEWRRGQWCPGRVSRSAVRLSRGHDVHRHCEGRHDRGNVQHQRFPVEHSTDGKLAGKANKVRRAVIAIALLAATACTRAPAGQEAIAITHVSVIDVASGATRPDNTVLISGNRITYVGPASGARIPSDARVVDGRGKFLIPGLWDMHVHAFLYVFSDFAGPLMIANGVTGARDMGYYIDTTLSWRSRIAAGREIGPRLVLGARADGPVNHARFVAHVVTEEDGVRAVDTLTRKKDGSRRADFVKPYSWVPRAAYFGLAAESKKLGVPLAGHVPYSISVVEASNAGQKGIEHEDDLMRACSSSDSALRAQMADTTTLSTERKLSQMRGQARILRATYAPAKCRSVIATLARNHTWVTPTLIVYQPYAHAFDSASTHPELAKYVPGLVKGGWSRRANGVTPRRFDGRAQLLQLRSHARAERRRREAARRNRHAAGFRLSGLQPP